MLVFPRLQVHAILTVIAVVCYTQEISPQFAEPKLCESTAQTQDIIASLGMGGLQRGAYVLSEILLEFA